MKIVKESLNEIKRGTIKSPLKSIGVSYKTSDGYIQQEEGMKLQRVGNWNYFKEKDPFDPWEPSKLNSSIRKVKLSDLILSETPSETKLARMGDYQQPEYTQYSTHWPVAIEYRGKLVLLDGHHRVTLAKRAGEKYMDIAVKNIDGIYESLNEIKRGKESGLGSIGVGHVAKYKGYYIMINMDPKCEAKLDQFKWYFDEKQVPERKMVSKILEVLGSTQENVLWFADWMELEYESKLKYHYLDKMINGEKFELIKFDEKEEKEIRKDLDSDPELEDYYYDYNAIFYPDYNMIQLTYTNSARNITRDGFIIAKPPKDTAVNEIKRGEASPLGSIGVGHTATLKGYDYIKNNVPGLIKKASFASEEFADKQYKFLKRAEQMLNISLDDHIWLEFWEIEKYLIIPKFVKSIKWDKKLRINPSTWDNADKRIVKYNYELNIGYMYASNGMFDQTRFAGYIIRYK